MAFLRPDSNEIHTYCCAKFRVFKWHKELAKIICDICRAFCMCFVHYFVIVVIIIHHFDHPNAYT